MMTIMRSVLKEKERLEKVCEKNKSFEKKNRILG